jgi:3-oxoacyl-[acyl-carrier protein] reductase
MCSADPDRRAGLVGRTFWIIGVCGPCGSTVNVIGPGPIATELVNKANDPERIKHIVGSAPVRRIGQPQDIAYTTGFFLDARVGFINGQVLYVCGGLTVGRVLA